VADIVEKYRLEGDTSHAIKEISKFAKAVAQSVKKTDDVFAQFNAEFTAWNKTNTAYAKAFVDQMESSAKQAKGNWFESYLKLTTAFEMVGRAARKFIDAAKEFEKDLEEPDRVVTNLSDAMGLLAQNAAGAVTQFSLVKDALSGITSAVDEMSKAIRRGDALGLLSALGDVGLGGYFSSKGALGEKGEYDFAGQGGFGGFTVAGKGKGKGKGTDGIEFGDLGEDAMAQYEANQQFWKDLAEAQKMRADAGDARLAFEEHLAATVSDIQEQAHQEQLARMQEEIDAYGEMGREVAGVMVGAFDALIDHGAEGLLMYLADYAKAKGQELFIDGAVTAAKGAAMLATGNPLGGAAITAGVQEMALGGAIMAGGYAAAAAMGGGGAGASAGGGVGGAGSGASTAPSGPRSPENVTVNVTTFGKMSQDDVATITREMSAGLRRGYR
jgi:hypothetical protein